MTFRSAKEALLLASLRGALREQGLLPLCRRLEALVPDLERQYTSFAVDSEYLRTKVRGQHAFQVSLALPELSELRGGAVADIGDSSGAHISYLKSLSRSPGTRWLSVNMDPEAVRKARARGVDAVHARAEELGRHGITADVFLCFETLEHLSDPADFLHGLSAGTPCRRLILTVPFVRQSRLGLHHIRAGLKKPVNAETTHLFELCPEDLRLLFRHCGWKVERDSVYLQYPRWSPLALTRPLWRRTDFEGFYGAVLSRDETWSSLYESWRDGKLSETLRK